MKTLSKLIALCAVFVSITAGALDISSTTPLERYTITNGTLEVANGYLLKDGKFKVLMSFTVDPMFYDSIDDFWPISGRPVMLADLFDGYQYAGVIPNWVRSRDTFWIGFAEYVIVSVKGGPDPNPIPTFIEQPENIRALEGKWAWFSTDAEPWDYVSYQWYYKNKPIPGATWSWLYLPDVGKTNAGIYTVSVSTGGQPIMSRKAMLTVVQRVALKTQPKSQTITAGKKAVLRVSATGTPPFTYEWYRNSELITNAVKSTYITTNSGSYAVVVGNGLSWAASTNAVATVTGQ